MQDQSTQTKPSDVKIYAPDTSLRTKIGGSFDSIFTPQVIKTAEIVVTNRSIMFEENMRQIMASLVEMNDQIELLPPPESVFSEIGDLAFSLKNNASMAGYDLVAHIARSLHLFCESLSYSTAKKNIDLIEWHIVATKKLVHDGVKGLGGPMGQKILEQIEKIHASQQVA